jgi:hypothetical protein
VVDFDKPTELQVSGTVRSVDEDSATAVLDLTATVAGETVLAKARVTVQLAR